MAMETPAFEMGQNTNSIRFPFPKLSHSFLRLPVRLRQFLDVPKRELIEPAAVGHFQFQGFSNRVEKGNTVVLNQLKVLLVPVGQTLPDGVVLGPIDAYSQAAGRASRLL